MHDTTQNVGLSLSWANLIVSVFIPLLVGFLLSSSAPSWLKGLTNVVASAIVAAISAVIDGGGSTTLVVFVGAFATSLLVSQATYQTVWKPTGTTTGLQGTGPQIGKTAD